MIVSRTLEQIRDQLRLGDQVAADALVRALMRGVEIGSNAHRYLTRILAQDLMHQLDAKPPKIHLVTPSFNSSATICRTIDSVISQRGNFMLHYHIQDGGSVDGTSELLAAYKSRIERSPCPRLVFTFSSAVDTGMYDALQRGFDGFEMSPNSWMGWINSDDQLADGALSLLARLAPCDEIGWVTGQPSIRLLNGVVKNHDIYYSNDLIASGLCDGRMWWFLQQEGTFWRSKFWRDASMASHFSRKRFAGDYHLWRTLAERTELYQYDGAIGHFNKRDAQISAACFDEYHTEIDSYWGRYVSRPRLRVCSTHTLKRLRFVEDTLEIADHSFSVRGRLSSMQL
jgi:glycosyltransferase involved in cell wall biosynthesis